MASTSPATARRTPTRTSATAPSPRRAGSAVSRWPRRRPGGGAAPRRGGRGGAGGGGARGRRAGGRRVPAPPGGGGGVGGDPARVARSGGPRREGREPLHPRHGAPKGEEGQILGDAS